MMESDITDLQIRLTHQESTIDALNETIIKQQHTIDQLTLDVEALKQRIRTLAEANIAHESEETPPPHY